LSANTIGSAFAEAYELTNLGAVPDLPAPYGGLVFAWQDPNTLLIGGSANNSSGAIYSVPLIRGEDNRIIGFAGPAAVHAGAPYIDGGLVFGAGGVLLHTAYPTNQLGQTLLGNSVPESLIDLTPLGITSSVGSLAFVPDGFPGAGRLKILSYNGGNVFDVLYTQNPDGTYVLHTAAQTASGINGPEGMIYVSGENPLFEVPSVLISEYGAGEVRAYAVDDIGDPIIGTMRVFVGGLTGAEGAAIDPLTGDFLFSTFGGGNQVVRVSGFTVIPEPAVLALLAGLGALALVTGRRARARPAADK
jgi:hypothetical protein